MPKRSSYELKKEILLAVKEKPATYATLERKINTGFRTIKNNCQELKEFGQLEIKEVKHPSNGKPASIISITTEGNLFLAKIKKNK